MLPTLLDSISTLALVGATLAFYVIVVVTRSLLRSLFSPLNTVPGPLLNKFTNLPLFYSILRGTYYEYSIRLHTQYGELVRLGRDHVSVSNASELRRILATHTFRKGANYERSVYLMPTVFSTTDPDLNRTRRRQFGSLYAMSSIRSMEDLILEHGVLSLIKSWDKALENSEEENCATVNYHYGFHGMSFDIIGILGFGKSFNVLSQGDTAMTDAFHKLLVFLAMTGRIPIIQHMRWAFKPLFDARDYVTQVVHRSIETRKAYIAENGKPPRIDLLQKIIDARDPLTGEVIDMPNLVSETALLLAAGTDTTSNTLSWTIMHLMHYPHVYQRLRDDIRREFPDHSTPIRYEEARKQLPYLTAVLNESMRVSPSVASYLPRRLPMDGNGATVCGHYIPHGAGEICLGIAACHRRSDIWPDPSRFDPERFMGADTDGNLKNMLAFSSGVRMCIGRNLAWVELYTTMANLLRRYDFKLPDSAPYGPHRTFNGIPEEIPGIAFITSGPRDPTRNCKVEISLAF
ncbi:hypothetical protein H4S07_001245 [Coemansia furcata]|uniref:Uncharacterized protein n=1 Tax=Coemansia furcata TaxID=417177 RepID=A0ACC1LP85_9FUNG|nr:hypothetical protein H4S07_001245 [Coemansia furcata]